MIIIRSKFEYFREIICFHVLPQILILDQLHGEVRVLQLVREELDLGLDEAEHLDGRVDEATDLKLQPLHISYHLVHLLKNLFTLCLEICRWERLHTVQLGHVVVSLADD